MEPNAYSIQSANWKTEDSLLHSYIHAFFYCFLAANLLIYLTLMRKIPERGLR
jgi:hypothetical protein